MEENQDQIQLSISPNTQSAMDYAFSTAQQYLNSGMDTFAQFVVSVVDEGLEISDHGFDDPKEVYESVRATIMADMPEGYALCYDGFVEVDEGELDAIIVEVADRGAQYADALCMLYTRENGICTFETDYGYVGRTDVLYPVGTRPIVSGLDALASQESASSQESGEPQE